MSPEEKRPAIAHISEREAIERQFPGKHVQYFDDDGWVSDRENPDYRAHNRRVLMWAAIWATLIAILLVSLGCASTGPVEMSPGVYMISKSSAAGMFTDLPKLKVRVIQEANKFAASKGKVVLPIKTSDSFPTHGFPSVEYQFELVDKDDPRLKR